MIEDQCPDHDRLGDYLGNRLGPQERARLEEHLSDCRDCRRRLVDSFEARSAAPEVGFPDELRRRAREIGRAAAAPVHEPVAFGRSKWAALAAAVLAGCALTLFLRHDRGAPAGDPETLRSSASAEVELLEPAVGEPLLAETVTFSWRAVPGTRRATLRVVDGLGESVYEAVTEATSVDVEASVFAGESDLYWYVRLTLDDGTQLESAARRLELVSPVP